MKGKGWFPLSIHYIMAEPATDEVSFILRYLSIYMFHMFFVNIFLATDSELPIVWIQYLN